MWAALQPWPGADFQRGAVYSSWDGSYSHRGAWTQDLERFRELGVTWIQVMTFAHQPQVDQPRIKPSPSAKWPHAYIAEARRRGFRILLKPHVWSRQFYDGSKRWRGSIAMRDEAGWDAWFDQYERFILREAALAQTEGVEMLCVGLEYVHASKHTERWRRLIRRVRSVYKGLLTYAADGNHEIGHIEFWDDLDVVGVNAYFKLADTPSPTALSLQLGWIPPLVRLSQLTARFQRPVVFTEAGYPSVRGAATQPWRWPNSRDTVDLQLQARAYEALMNACTAMPWCRGVYWWKWYERPENHSHAHDYSPEDKPAEEVIRNWYRVPAPQTPAGPRP